MKTDFSKLPREEVEARITTMLMGELDAEEARALMEFVAGDAELMRLHDELKATIGLVREASAAENRISEGKREALLASFKMVTAPELAGMGGARRRMNSWVALAAMVAFLLVVSALMLPSFTKSRSSSHRYVAVRQSEEERKSTVDFDASQRGEAMADAAFSRASEDFSGGRLALKPGPSRGVNDRAPAAAEPAPATTEAKREEVRKQLATTYSVRYFGDADKDGAGVPQTKIELPALAETGSEVEGKKLGLQGGTARGFGGFGAEVPGMPAQAGAEITTVGKNLNVFYSDQPSASRNPFAGRSDFGEPGQANQLGDPVWIGVLERKSDAVAPSSGLPMGPAANAPAGSATVAAGDMVAQNGQVAAEMGGGRANMDYQSNPDFTKRARAGANVGSTEASTTPPAQRPAVKGVADDRFGTQSAGGVSGVAGVPGMKAEQEVALGTELKLVEPKSEVSSRGLTVEDLGQKNEVLAFDLSKLQEGGRPELDDRSSKERADTFGRAPSEKLVARQEEFQSGRVQTSTLVQDARSLIELGRTTEAEKLLKQAQQNDPDHRAAGYYLNLLKEQRYAQEGRNREIAIKERLVDVEKSWQEPLGREMLPTPSASNGKAKAERELEIARSLRDSIQARIAQETTEAQIPKSGPLQTVDRAQAGDEEKPSMFGRLLGRGQQRVARVEVTKEGADISPLMPNQQSHTYDPYFIQSAAEQMRSQQVLGEVVDQLKLDEKWGKGGRKIARNEAVERLRDSITVQQAPNTSLVEIRARAEKDAEAAQIANTVAEVYQKQVASNKVAASQRGIEALSKQLAEFDQRVAEKEAEVERLRETERVDVAAKKPVSSAPVPQPEVLTAENAFSTFSLNVSDVSFKLAAASLEKGLMPDAATVRSEEFINAFDYRDPEPQGAPVGFVWERARYPFAQDRDLVRFSVKTAASGRQAGRPLNLVLLLDSSGSMERSDRVRILRECLKTLAAQLRPEDRVSVVAFARTARLWVDGLPGSQAGELPARVGNLAPEGGTNLEEAMRVAYETARKHFSAEGVNRVVLLTDGAANLGDVEPESLKKKVEAERRKGIALDCFGIGWEGLNDELLETLSRNGDGRYGFVNSTEAAGSEFAGQLAGALKVAASDVKVQVEWNPKRVTAYRQIGYAKHQLTKEQFRDNTVDAAEIGAAEAGNALYTVQVNPAGEGPLGTVRVRFKVPGTDDYREHEWPLNYDGAAKSLENSSYPLRLAGTASAFSEWLVSSPYAGEVTTDRLLSILSGVPEHFAPDPRPKKLEWMIRQAKSVAGK